jgi:hypothetical protein
MLHSRQQFGLDFRKHLLPLAALNAGDIVLIFQERAERVGDGLWIERQPVEFCQRRRPVDGLGNAGILEQVDRSRCSQAPCAG